MDYTTFAGIVVNGRKDLINGNDNVMPSFAENKNVTCYLNDIYVYLRARSQDAVPRGRPAKHEPKPASYDANETKCSPRTEHARGANQPKRSALR